MRVVCDNCGASYKIPDSKLTKEVNKATCRKCGHAIYIRKAGDDAPAPRPEPPPAPNEERTLITSAADLERAVRTRSSPGVDEAMDLRPTTVSPENGHGESTVPRDDQIGLRASQNTIVPDDDAPRHDWSHNNGVVHEISRPPAASPSRPPEPVRPPSPPAYPAARPAAPNPSATFYPTGPAISPAPVAAPAPAPVAAPAIPSSAFATPASYAAPVVAPAPAAAPAHDPRGDVTLAQVAHAITFGGMVVLFLNGWFGNALVAGLGVFLALAGLLTSFMLLATGGRGTRPASKTWSVLGGMFLGAAGGAIGGVVVHTTGDVGLEDRLASATTPAPVAPAPVTVAPVPVVATTPAPDALAAVAAPTPTEVTSAPAAEAAPAATAAPAPVAATPTPAPAAAPAPAPKAASSSSGSSSSSRRTETAVAAADDPPARITPKSSSSSSSAKSTYTPPPEPAPAPAPKAAATGVSTTVIDTMIRSNKGVKTCFINEKAESGDLPRGVKVRLTIQPTGKVSSASIPSGDWAGTPFDSCLSGAVKGITFPPFEGDPVTLTYPFAI
ncbi:MAG: AgmX/PglI C-terminal domain-containing protein [Myxococcota bacterium]